MIARLFKNLLSVMWPRLFIVLPTNTPGNKGGILWDQAMQSGAPQSAIPLIPGGPNGVVFAPVGSVCVDDVGKLWVKTTAGTSALGWEYATLNAPIA